MKDRASVLDMTNSMLLGLEELGLFKMRLFCCIDGLSGVDRMKVGAVRVGTVCLG